MPYAADQCAHRRFPITPGEPSAWLDAVEAETGSLRRAMAAVGLPPPSVLVDFGELVRRLVTSIRHFRFQHTRALMRELPEEERRRLWRPSASDQARRAARAESLDLSPAEATEFSLMLVIAGTEGSTWPLEFTSLRFFLRHEETAFAGLRERLPAVLRVGVALAEHTGNADVQCEIVRQQRGRASAWDLARWLVMLLQTSALSYEQAVELAAGFAKGAPTAPSLRKALRQSFRLRFPAEVERIETSRPSPARMRFIKATVSPQSTVISHELLGQVVVQRRSYHLRVLSGDVQRQRRRFTLLDAVGVADEVARVFAERWVRHRLAGFPASWTQTGRSEVPALFFPRHAPRAASRKRYQRWCARTVMRLAREVCTRQMELAGDDVHLLHKRAYRALGRVPPALSDPRFYERASAHLKSDLIRHPAAWGALALVENVCNDSDALVYLMENWMGVFAGAAMKPPKSTRKVLMQWPATLSSIWASALVGHHVEWQPRTYLELIYSTVLPFHPRLYLSDRFAVHPNAMLVRRATDAEIRAAFHWAREFGLLKDRGTLRRVTAHATLARYVFDDPRPYHGRWPALVQRAAEWHRQHGWNREEEPPAERGEASVGMDALFRAVPGALVSTPGVQIEHLGDMRRLSEEGRRMHHCVGQYGARAALGQCFLFHVTCGDDTATVETDPAGFVVQAYGPCNQPNRASGWAERQHRLFVPGVDG